VQLRAIVLFSRDGRRRVLRLEPGRVNIVTGRSRTGKSQLINIVDYCLGKSTCDVASGPIRDTVSWYGLLLEFPNGQMFIARENPSGTSTTNRAFIAEGARVNIPDSIEESNTRMEDVELAINARLGISPNMNIPSVGQTRDPLSANFRHATLFSFQAQDEIASPRQLFHRQSDAFMSQAIKDTLPYFLGAIQEDALAIEQELRRARRAARQIQRQVEEAEALRGQGLTRAQALLSEAQQLGLIAQQGAGSTSLEGITDVLRIVQDWIPEQQTSSPNDELPRLIERRQGLEQQRLLAIESIGTARTYAEEIEGFSSAASEQALRLESVHLYRPHEHDAATCPLCLQPIPDPLPSISAIEASLQTVRSALEGVGRDRPQFRSYIERLENSLAELDTEIGAVTAEIQALYEQDHQLERLRNLDVARGRVAGRISLWLESVEGRDNLEELRQRMTEAEQRAQLLAEQVDPEDRQRRLTLILTQLALPMTHWARELKLEHAEPGSYVMFDLPNVTIMVQSSGGTIPLRQIGSGANWLGYHLVIHFALHEHFVRQRRPTPRFLFLDQPTQVYFPEDEQGSPMEERGELSELSETDRSSVERMFNFVFDTVESLAPNFQVIICDHADLINDERFQAAIRERWRDGAALIPEDWIEDAQMNNASVR